VIVLLPSTFRNLDNNRITDIQDGAFDGLNDLLEMYVLKLATVQQFPLWERGRGRVCPVTWDMRKEY